MQEHEGLFIGFDPIFLWRHQIKQRFGTAIQLMQFTVKGLAVVLPTTFIKYGKKEGAVVKGAVFDGIV